MFKYLSIYYLLPIFLIITACGSEEEMKENESNTSDQQTNDSSQPETSPESFSVETVATELNVPWAIQSHDDHFYVTERNGTIARIDENGTVHRQNVESTEEIVSNGEGGLLGFILDPNFSESQKAYLYHSYQQNNSILNRIIAVTKQGESWIEEKILLDNIPGSQIHNGGRLKIGPDGFLYATTGDANMEDKSQQTDNFAGSILRMTLDGSVPDDNPIDNSYVYSYGHRNPQGLDWNEDNQLYSSEHGSSAHDEINHIQPGENYGWPVITGDEEQNDMETPLLHSGSDTWAPSGSTFDSNNNFYVTGLRGTQLMRIDMEEETMEVVFSGEGRLRDVFIRDDDMYVITNNRDGRGNPDENDDQLLKLSHFENHSE
ncbi:PQQ-dependent sugar dehydrogenase [Salibacterium salarium]|uniref:PQQ-dependent sugar dehydrogenase n=1 Tax=Salibacterium salarium TaxID=284579 RepID=UPI001FE991AE|nr:PQQ-dependent sugar dehydrogenase [Salibacterium salarium]